MLTYLKKNDLMFFLIHGIITWIIFLISFLLLTEGVMFVMQLEGIAILFLIIGSFCLVLNYYNLKRIVNYKPKDKFKANVSIYNYHQIIASLERVFRVIVILTSLGLISSLSTFFIISMEFFTLHSLNSLFKLIPLLFIVYLVFAIPSFYGLKEINQIKYFLDEFKNMKVNFKKSLSINELVDN